jgi:hypothetical protein
VVGSQEILFDPIEGGNSIVKISVIGADDIEVTLARSNNNAELNNEI